MSASTLEARLAARRSEIEEFERAWRGFARTWRKTLRSQGPEATAALVAGALVDGIPSVRPGQAPDVPDHVLLAAARSVVAASGYLDADAYPVHHRVKRGVDPVQHYVATGWRHLENPSPRFDLWSYWVEHLDPTDDTVDPLLHWLLWGRHRGAEPVPVTQPVRDGLLPRPDRTPRRVCLFAAYDRDGLVDDYVVTYLRELSRHCDVYYLADGVLEPGEIDKLAEVTAGAWSIPHGGYDFGSFSMLARDLVGWDVVETYDELVLANDSCFLLRHLDDVLAEMDGRRCDWWSLQATSMEHDENYFRDDEPLPAEESLAAFVGPRKWKDVDYLHLSSYFLVFRQPVLRDEGFRWRLDTVVPQRAKGLVVHKYEVGISRYLTDAGFGFDTWLEGLHAFHPLYSRRVFDYVGEGFPVVKRNFLGENPRRAPGVERWRERLAELLPAARLDEMEANIRRVTDPARLHEAYRVTQDPATGRRFAPIRPLPDRAFRRLDRETPTFDHWWGFVPGRSGRLDPGVRAVLDAVRHDPSVRKVVLPRTRALLDDVSGAWVDVVPLDTTDGQEALVRCGVIVLDDAPDLALDVVPVAPEHAFVHVGAPPPADRGRRGDWSAVRWVAVGGAHDALLRSATSALAPDSDRLRCTGLPRHDLLGARIPDDLARAEAALRHRLAGRPLVVWWHTGPRPVPPGADEVRALGEHLRRHDLVLGLREDHPDRPDSLTRSLHDLGPVGLGDRSVVSAAVVLRVAAVVVTDSCQVAHDALTAGGRAVLLGAPEVGSPWADPALDDLPRHRDLASVAEALGSLESVGSLEEPAPLAAQPTRGADVAGTAARRLVRAIRSRG